MAKTAPTANNFQPPTYQKGFNQAYLLAKHSPELLAKLIPSIQPTNEYYEGFLLGKEQFDKEQRTKNKGAVNAPSKDKDRDMDKDR